MAFALYGFYRWNKNHPQHKSLPMLIFIAFFYVVSSWTCWYYASSFSQRALIDSYPLLALGMGQFVQIQIHARKWLLALVVLPLLSFNLFQSYQAEKGIIDLSRMTGAYYFSTFGQLSPPTPAQQDLLLIDRISRIEKGFQDRERYRNCYQKTVYFDQNKTLNEENRYSDHVDLLPAEISQKDHFWVRAIWKYEGKVDQLQGKVFNISAMYKGKAYQYIGREIGDSLLEIDTAKHEVTFEYLSPEMRSPKDVIRIIVWNREGEAIRLRSLQITCFERKD